MNIWRFGPLEQEVPPGRLSPKAVGPLPVFLSLSRRLFLLTDEPGYHVALGDRSFSCFAQVTFPLI